MMIGTGDFIASSSADYRSACAAELCGALAALQGTDCCLLNLNYSSMVDASVATDCLGVVRRFERQAQVIIMATKLNPICVKFFC